MTSAVLHRELRTLGRQWPTYWLRVLAGVVGILGLTGAFLFIRIEGVNMPVAWVGSTLFFILHLLVCVLLGVVTPFLTADCVSKERREGTLGLLFLTPLSAWDVVLGKCVAHVFRAWMLWLAMVPVLAVPYLLGGLTVESGLRALALQMTLLMGGLGAGIMGTRKARTWASAMGRAACFVFLGGLLLVAVVTLAFWTAYEYGIAQGIAGAGVTGPNEFRDIPWYGRPFVAVGMTIASAHSAALSGLGGFPAGVKEASLWAMGAAIGFSFIWFLLATLLLRNHLASRWQEGPIQSNAAGSSSKASIPSPQSAAKSTSRQPSQIGSNPFVWLQNFRSGPRLSRWLWVTLVFVCWMATLVLYNLYDEVFVPVGWMPLPFLLLAAALAAAGSYRQEIEEGTLELFLVATLPPRLLVTGRVKALLWIFGPAMVLLWLLGALLSGVLELIERKFWGIWWGGFLISLNLLWVFPLIGMRCAMRRVAPLMGWFIICFWGGLAPLVAASIMTASLGMSLNWVADTTGTMWVILMLLWQGAAGAWWGLLTWRELESRRFMLRPFQRIKPQ